MTGHQGVRVRLHGGWIDDEALRQGLRAYRAGEDPAGIELTLGDDFDILVVFDYPTMPIDDPAKTVVLQGEPAPSRARHQERFLAPPEDYLAFYDVERHHAVAVWHVGRADAETIPEKSRVLSAVVSATSFLPAHSERLDFVTKHLSRLPELDHFGRGEFSGPAYRGPVEHKAEALLPYRYTFNSENWREPNYFTEKILDAILCETLCFYDGCPNLELFLDPETFVRVDIRRPAEALHVIEQAIARDEWSRRIGSIRAQKQQLLDELNPLEIVRKVVLGEPVVWRAERLPRDLDNLEGVTIDLVDVGVPDAGDAALRRIAAGRELGIVLDARAQIVDGAASTLAALADQTSPGDLVLIGGTGVEPFRHVAAHQLSGGRELRHVVPTGGEKPSAYAATPEAARTLLRLGGAPLRNVTLRAVWPPLAYLPGPFMRRDGRLEDDPLLPGARPSSLHRLAESVVPRLPRGRRLATAGVELGSLTAVPARRMFRRVARGRT